MSADPPVFPTAGTPNNNDAAAFLERDSLTDPSLPRGDPPVPPLSRGEGVDPIPLAMLNAFVYCPRRFHYEFVQGVMQDNAHVVQGRRRHARVDDPALAERPRAEGEAVHTRSVWLTSEVLGITGKIDVVEETHGEVVPVEYKKGRPPSREQCPDGYWPNDAVQLCAQAMLLESTNGELSRAVPGPDIRGEDAPARTDDRGEDGSTGLAGVRPARVDDRLEDKPVRKIDGSSTVPRVERGYLYFAGSRQRVEVIMSDSLRRQTLDTISAAHRMADQDEEPLPLLDSPKCPSCSLVTMCMPDETNRLRAPAEEIAEESQGQRVDREAVRCLIPSEYDTEILYVTEQGATIGKSGDRFMVRDRQGLTLAEAPGAKLRQICVYGYAQLTTQAAHACMEAGIDVAYFSTGGRLKGHLMPLPNANGLLRSAVAKALQSEAVRLALARGVVTAKIGNQRVILMRNTRADARDPGFDRDVEQLSELARSAAEAESRQSLLGIEGAAARAYFGRFAGMLRGTDEGGESLFDFEHRNRRPPRDPVNALLSLAYSCLCKDAISAVAAVGLDPYIGALHESRRGQPALALDLMEEFRPIIADSVVLTLINNRMLSASNFHRGRQSCNLTDKGRKTFFEAYERRKTEECTHPVFDYKTSYVRLIEMQARVMARFMTGQIPAYAGFRTR